MSKPLLDDGWVRETLKTAEDEWRKRGPDPVLEWALCKIGALGAMLLAERGAAGGTDSRMTGLSDAIEALLREDLVALEHEEFTDYIERLIPRVRTICAKALAGAQGGSDAHE